MKPKIAPCHGLKPTTNAGTSFTDTLRRVYDLERERLLRPKEASAEPRMAGASTSEILRLVRAGELYPVLRRNARVILIFDCALTDWRLRQLTPATSRRRGTHLHHAA